MSDRERAKEWIDKLTSPDLDRILYFMNLVLTKRDLYNEYYKRKEEIERLHNTIKEVREEIRILESNCDIVDYQAQKLYQILDKGE